MIRIELNTWPEGTAQVSVYRGGDDYPVAVHTKYKGCAGYTANDIVRDALHIMPPIYDQPEPEPNDYPESG